jgi:hypothetical protein
MVALDWEDGTGNFQLFYQHQSGDIREAKYSSGNWSGGGSSDVVTKDAKNGTSISGIGYMDNDVHYVREEIGKQVEYTYRAKMRTK